MDRREIREARAGLDGLSLEAAVTVVDEPAESDTIRETLAIVAEDGVIRRTAVDGALANASKVVATAETRAELAATSLEDVRDTAEPVSDLDLVTNRLNPFETRLEIIEDRTTDLGDRVQIIINHKHDGDLYDLAREIRRVTATANEIQRAADNLQLELGTFEEWLEDPDHRVAELVDDIDAFEQSLDELDSVATDLAADDTELEDDAAVVWVQGTIQHRVTALMVDDIQYELATLREWADREGADRPAGVDQRLDDLEAHHDALGERFANCAESPWYERFGDRVEDIDDALGEMESPVAWNEVEAVIKEHQPSVE
ncbi:halo transducer protein [Natrialba sp. PRR66]|uniref:halo transducer protein n=1 Tax=Natrialba sp. PRR66 TaxID=3098146 RepID=UPI002B1E3F17|nr:halo transducer protein [Natrialba sp. PRR66]